MPGFRAGVPAFFAGWLTSELAPHLLALTAADAAANALSGRRRDRAGLALAGGQRRPGWPTWSRQSRKVQHQVEDALVEGLGVDYVEQLDATPTPAELATPWRKLVNPFRMRDARRPGREGPPLHRRRPPRPARRLPARPTATSSDAPVLLQVHGGGWTIGTKDQQGIPLMQHMAARGLGLRRDQLPARAARPLPRAHRST